VAEVEQQLRGVHRAGELIDRDQRHRVGPARLDRHDRDAGGQVDQGVRPALLRRDDEDPVDALHPQALDGAQNRAAVQGQEADDADEVARGVGGLLDGEERRRRAVERGVEADDPERPRASGDEGPRGAVGTVVEPAHGGENPVPGFRANVRIVVDHARDGLMGDARQLGDVGHDGGAAMAITRAAGVG
jgi:hypothetical protein